MGPETVWMSLLLLSLQAAPPREPVRCADGSPLVVVYYFGHWWDPWKSDDTPIRADLARLRDMGVSCIAVDHEWSQAIDGDWKWLDREHRLAREAGLGVLPWLSLKTWSDLGDPHRIALAEQWYGTRLTRSRDQKGELAGPALWDEQTIEFGARYAIDYLDRYRDQALLKVVWMGATRPVICLSVEAACVGGFDDGSIARFRAWLGGRYAGLAALNAAWCTELASFDAIDPRDTAVFDYDGHVTGRAAHPRAVEDHVEFRSWLVNDCLSKMAERVRAKHPDVLFLAEVPYQYGSEHPHAVGYRIGYGANPTTCDFADLVLFRNTGPLTAAEAEALAAARERTGQRFILTYRTYSDWDKPADDPKFGESVALYAGQAAALADGFGFYSWNEMVDVHVAWSPTPPAGHGGDWTAERSERAIGLLAAMVRKYRELVGAPVR